MTELKCTDNNKQNDSIIKTALYLEHINAGAKMIDFHNFYLPINYGSQLKEHEIVRTDAGMFDVSHMLITDITGKNAQDFLSYLLSNNIHKLQNHQAMYSAFLNNDAGIIDDLIVYKMPKFFRIISNGATRDKVIDHINHTAKIYQKEILNINNDATLDSSNLTIDYLNNHTILAIQGPKSLEKFGLAYPDLQNIINTLAYYSVTFVEKYNFFIARTGYTGELGIELICNNQDANTVWHKLLHVNIHPIGLAARDTLRLEAGMNLYGQDMDELVSPLECGMSFAVDFKDSTRDFIGKNALLKLREQFKTQNFYKQCGLILLGNGILRSKVEIFDSNNECVGFVTSGTFSPSMKCSIAIARISNHSNHILATQENTQHALYKLYANIRNKLEPVRLIKLPFIKNGKILGE